MGSRREPSSPEAHIPPPSGKEGRDRSWDRKHNFMVVSYRGIPKQLHQEITKIAAEQEVPVGEVARALLEYALRAYQEGRLELNPAPRSGKLTLFSDD